MNQFTKERVHIENIRVGDIVIHDGKARTVGRDNLKRSTFYGKTLFGDCYMIGHKKVIRLVYKALGVA